MKNPLLKSLRLVRFGYFFFIYLSFLWLYSAGNISKDRISVRSESHTYLVPFISGQGLNNQLWEYRSAAIIAKATNRRLCLEPFHRFYLQNTGRKFIPFEDLFDEENLQPFVLTATREECAQKCKNIIHRHLVLVNKEASKTVKKKPIADWRPGSLDLFYRSTGFQYLPFPEFININSTDHGVRFDSLEAIEEVLAAYVGDRCISTLGTTPTLSQEFLEWSRVLKVNQNIKNTVKQIKTEMFSNKPFLSIHWRFEESKCAGYGRGIGFGRSIETHQSKMVAKIKNKKVQVRRSDIEADLCFFAGPLPSKMASSGIWLRLVSKMAVVNWIRQIKKERNIDHVYIATDCSDEELLQWIKRKTGAITKSNIEPIISHFVSPEENDILSRVEQQICTDSSLFGGTSMSSWTSSVIEERFKNRNSFFTQDKYALMRRPDPMNQTLYFDIEVCNCEWDSLS